MIPFGFWHPDAASINSPAVLKAENVYPAVLETARGLSGAFKPALGPVATTVPVGLDPLLDDPGAQIYVSSGSQAVLDDISGAIFSDDLTQLLQSDTDLADANPVYVTDTAVTAQNGMCFGLVGVVQNTGSVVEIAGTATALCRLSGNGWSDVSRISGGAYTLSAGERWRFAAFNPYILATDYTDVVQKYDTSLATLRFTALGGSPPRARYIGIVREQVVLAALFGQENALQFSGRNNSEIWTTGGVNGADIQSFPDGGPITGFVGGAVGHVFQATKVRRMTATADPTLIFQFDEVQGGKGCVAPNSIVQVGDLVYYFASDGFQVLSVTSGQVKPLGVNKWRQWFLEDYRPGTEGSILGAADPLDPVVYWAYKSKSSSTAIPDRLFVYDWSIDEATYLTVNVEAMTSWLTASLTLETLTPYGNMETLPFSLDSPFWKGGVPLLTIVDGTHAAASLAGSTLAAEIITADGQRQGRSMVMATRPAVDTALITGAIAMRERDGDAIAGQVVFPVQEVMEDTGQISAFTSGNIGRARYRIPAGATWTSFKGVETDLGNAGNR